MRKGARVLAAATALALLSISASSAQSTAAAPRTVKPVLHGRHWIAITGKPLAATAGALMFAKGGNAVDAPRRCSPPPAPCGTRSAGAARPRRWCTILTQRRSIGVNALGVAPTGATPELYQGQGPALPARVRPARRGDAGHPRRLITMLAEWGRLSLAGGAGAGDPDGRRLSRSRHSSRTRSSARSSGSPSWPYSKAMLPAARGRAARGAGARARCSCSPTSPRRCASWSRPSSGARRRQEPPARRF